MGRRESRTPRSVRVADIESGEQKSPLVDSIIRCTNPHYRYRFVFNVGGNLVERTYAHFNCSNDGRDGSFSKLVKVFFPDGSWKYAIKGFRAISETTRMELVSLYAGKLRNPSTGKWEWPGTLYASEAPDDAVGKMVPFYNEEIESAVKTGNFNKKFKSRNEAVGYGMIYKYMNQPASRFYRWMNTLTMSQTLGHDASKQVAGIGEEMVVDKPQYSHPPAGYEKWRKCAPRFFTYRRDEYIKSFYKPRQKTIWKPELFYLEDLLAIYDEWTPREVGDENSAMVWNSLDATCKGNV